MVLAPQSPSGWMKKTPASKTKKLPFCNRMYREWPFFESMLSNMDMVLAKSDLAIAYSLFRTGDGQEFARYRLLAYLRRTSADPEQFRNHHKRKRTSGEQPALARALKDRLAYIDPLNHLQVELIKRHRNPGNNPENLDARATVAFTSRSTVLPPACAIQADTVVMTDTVTSGSPSFQNGREPGLFRA